MMKSVKVNTDEITNEISRVFDYEFDGVTTFEAPSITSLDREMLIGDTFSIGLIVGPSGSGKSTLLRDFGIEEHIEWYPDKAVCSHFKDAEDAQERLAAVGFNTIPAWLRPYHVLSNGEKFRADLARKLKDGAVVDEFTSVIDRNVAKAASVAIRRYVDQKGLKNIVFAGCHYDIIEWLQPDWVFDTVTGSVTTRGSERRPEVVLEILPCTTDAWALFRDHHYLSGDINKSSRCWIAVWNGEPVGFSANLALPSGSLQNAWKGHRTVILPDYQGMGFGVRMSEGIAEIFLAEGKRYFTKTAHPRLGEYREASPKWRGTSHNKKSRQDYAGKAGSVDPSTHAPSPGRKYSAELMQKHMNRVTYAHEYIGDAIGEKK